MKKPALQGSSTIKSNSNPSDESRETKHHPPEEQLASAIRELRQSLSLTQVQLATALGIAPTSIYRYEAGSSFPDVNSLASFWQFAINKRSPAAITFTAILASAIPALQPVLESSFQIDPETLGNAEETRLTPDQGLLVMAFIKLLHSSATDPLASMARKVCQTLLEPWYEESKKELSQQIQKHFRQAFRASKQPTKGGPKPTAKE